MRCSRSQQLRGGRPRNSAPDYVATLRAYGLAFGGESLWVQRKLPYACVRGLRLGWLPAPWQSPVVQRPTRRMSNAAAAASNSVLASIFVLSLLLLFLVPYTLCVFAGWQHTTWRSSLTARPAPGRYILFGSSGEHSAAAPAKRSDARPTGGPAKKVRVWCVSATRDARDALSDTRRRQLKPGASKRWLNGSAFPRSSRGLPGTR